MGTIDLYSDYILFHFDSPYHKSEYSESTHFHTLRNTTCGDQIELQLRIKDGRIQRAYHLSKGCVISQAAASILCQHIEGKAVSEIEMMQAQDMLALLKIQLTLTRQQCGLLPFKALKTILYSLDQQDECLSLK